MTRRLNPWSVARDLLLWVAALTVTLPLLWVALASFKAPAQLNDPGLLIFTPNLENWARVLEAGILEAAGRSAMVAGITVAVISASSGLKPPRTKDHISQWAARPSRWPWAPICTVTPASRSCLAVFATSMWLKCSMGAVMGRVDTGSTMYLGTKLIRRWFS